MKKIMQNTFPFLQILQIFVLAIFVVLLLFVDHFKKY